MRAVSKISGILLMVSGCLFAQNSEISTDHSNIITPDQKMDMLFDQIVRSIPEKSKNVSDTVSSESINGNRHMEHATTPETVQQRRSEMTRALSDDLRKQVERAIEEIDLEKIEHSPSFIENRSGR